MRAPCKRPKVLVEERVDAPGGHVAACAVPGCGWTYGAIGHAVKTDAQRQAALHRLEHRVAVPHTGVVGPVPEWEVWCDPCGGHRRTFGTRREAAAWLEDHLRSEHQVVTCP